ncbi:superinfection immunity protein [Streptomyces sp. NPDC045714]|uniref:superinfection immunity protein n=1 Tax=Streptomyces sp. NPDC045714 TaxID=3154913 RepID=UPI00340531AC
MLSNISPFELLIAVPLGLLVLLVPSIIAYRRKVERLWLVIVVSLISVPTGLLWFVALYMALTMRARAADVPPLSVSGGTALS